MESFNDSHYDNRRTIALGMPPFPPTSQSMEGQSSQNPNIDPQKLKRTLASRQHGKVFRLKQISRIMKLEWTLKSLQVDVERQSAMMCYWKQQHYLIGVKNDELKQKLGFYSFQIESKEAEYVQLNKEKDMLRRVYLEQQRAYEQLMKSNMANDLFKDMHQPGHSTYNFM